MNLQFIDAESSKVKECKLITCDDLIDYHSIYIRHIIIGCKCISFNIWYRTVM